MYLRYIENGPAKDWPRGDGLREIAEWETFL